MTVEVFVEIPKGSSNKYEWDHHAGGFRLDRVLYSAVHYPGDYGFIPNTWSGDDDPLDALVLLGDGTFPGCSITSRVVGVFHMADDKGEDAKIITVADQDPRWSQVEDIGDVPPHVLKEVEHFFSVYKDLERKKVTTEGFENRAAALEQIELDRERFRSLETKPRIAGGLRRRRRRDAARYLDHLQ